jgi:outer membrane protein assembly factor BamA
MRLIFLILSLLFSTFLRSQGNYKIEYTSDDYKKVKANAPLEFKDSLSALNYLKELRLFGVKKGYLTCSLDSLYFEERKCRVVFYVGQKFGSIELRLKSSSENQNLHKGRFNEKLIQKIPFKPIELSRFIRSAQDEILNNGHPFGRINLQNISYNGEHISAELNIETGRTYHFNKIILKGDSSISEIFISSLIDIKSGDLYNESKLKSITTKIKQISFLKEIKPHELLFTDKGCDVYIYLQSNPVSSVNGTIGLQPNPITNRVGLAGDVNLKLLNVLKRGESAILNWRSIQSATQSMNVKINYPFLFRSPFGIDAQLQLYKKDSTFLELKSTLGIQYFLKGGNYLKAFYQNYASNTLSGASGNSNFNNLSNVSSNSYGLSLFNRQLDYIPNPSKGYTFFLEGSIGSRKSKISDTSSVAKSTVFRVNFTTEWFLPISRRNIIRFATVNEFYYAPEIYQNELYRFGGQNSLRGFNEDELFASAKSVLTIEYRFLLDRNSNLFVFYDQAYYENSGTKYSRDHPFGFGTGLSFGTNLGIFSVSYALGSQMQNAILLNNGKIHFGYIAYF